MKLSVIVPVYNEEKTVLEILEKLLKVKEVSEVVVVNDGSVDDTDKNIKKFLKTGKASSKRGSKKTPATKLKRIKYFRKENGGKGSAVRLGLTKVTGDYTMIQDADLEYDPNDIVDLVKPIKAGKAEIIYGSRFLGPHTNLLFWHRLGNAFLNFLVNVLYNTTLSDMETCYKLLPTKVFRSLNIRANKFDMEPEITCKVLKLGHRIYEVPISYVGRDFSEGKKITWVDGFDALKVIFGLRLIP